jgi:hypothetical protein
LIADGNHIQDTMTRAMHIETISAQGTFARGIGSCIARGMGGFPNSLPKTFGTDATT